MKRYQLSVLASLIALSSSVQGQTLEQAIAITLATNPDLRASYNDYASYVELHNKSRGDYLPTLDLDAGIGYEGIDPVTGDGTDLTRKEASLILRQLIWDGGATWNDMDRTAAEAESMRMQLHADASDKALEVTKIYLDAVKAHEVLALSESNLATHKRIFRNIRKRAESGVGSTADLSQIETRLARAHGNLLAAQNNIYDAHTQFTRIVSQGPQGLIFPQADEEAIPTTLQDAVDQANQSHPVIKIAQADVEAARFQYKQSKGAYYPTFSFEANQTWYDDVDGIEGGREELTVMLRMKYNLFNGGSDHAQSEQTAYMLNKAKDLRDAASKNVEESLRLAWSALDLTLQQKEFLADQVDTASDTVDGYEKQYLIGQRTLLDLLNMENELFEARKDYLDAHYEEQYAKYRVLNSTGILLESLLVDTPSDWNNKQDY
ncbi:TolC family outer membrane protein [Vibrio sp. SCSIO 43137]|uniref:TolC family outer membrane protein n=1 Tax=Vibrio sp. SCSIO 43137 TaxID=3021011 RepID=UPI002307A921|nr:TolC family outer membrane protein [Vibrio sp. SCSIO 43137]WCE31063.1 TolC family outer membrane protein [Vibrio sp. SCSIO 43137]